MEQSPGEPVGIRATAESEERETNVNRAVSRLQEDYYIPVCGLYMVDSNRQFSNWSPVQLSIYSVRVMPPEGRDRKSDRRAPLNSAAKCFSSVGQDMFLL